MLALLLLPAAPRAFADVDSNVLRGVYDALEAQDSDYSQTKVTYTEYYPETVFEDTLADDGFTLTVSGNEYFEGSWTYTLEGDYLVSTVPADDYTGAIMSNYVLDAVGRYYNMNTELLDGYIIGLNAMEIENNYFIMENDEAAGTRTIRIYVAGPYEMKELDEMLLDTPVLDYEPLGEDYISMASNCGKLSMIANGTADGVTVYVGEYGGLDELAYQSILNVVKMLQPVGWESFLENYTELADAETEDYTVALNVDAETAAQDFEPRENVSYARLRFGEEESYDEWEFVSDWPPVEALTEHYFRALAKVETGTAGASLKTAAAACFVCGFASAYDLEDADIEQLRANLVMAYGQLDEDEQTAFWQGFDAVRALLDSCLEDYGAERAVFEDAGRAEEMDMYMGNEQVLTAWENLRDYTLTMDNETAG